jgi:hypothetical protein
MCSLRTAHSLRMDLQCTTNGGANWSAVGKFSGFCVTAFGFGASAPGESYPAVYVAAVTISGITAGAINIWRSTDDCVTWTNLGAALNSWDSVTDITGDPNNYGVIYLTFGGSGAGWFGVALP